MRRLRAQVGTAALSGLIDLVRFGLIVMLFLFLAGFLWAASIIGYLTRP